MSSPTINDIHVERDDGSILSPDIDDFLDGLGYKIDTSVTAGHYSRGFKRLYKISPNPTPTYYLHLHINSDRARGYKEYSCGGEVDSFKIETDENDIQDLESFKEFMNEVFDRAFSSHEDPVPA